MTAEQQRLEDDRLKKAHWKRWGPYLSERQWGTVREDYSAHGEAWEFFPHDQARSRAYRWGEDGIAGISDSLQRLCFSLALWNEKDPILKERLFGLTGNQGNHGEDVKEYYFYGDNTPTHSYMKYFYKYPQAAFPYKQLLDENSKRGKNDPEYELLDTGIFNDNRYFDVTIEYAKNSPTDMLIKISITNCGPVDAQVHVLPHLWYRNTWSWKAGSLKPQMSGMKEKDFDVIEANHATLGSYWLFADSSKELLFTENETNAQKLFGLKNAKPYVKDSINDYIVDGKKEAVNPQLSGTKAALHYALTIAPGQTATVNLRLADQKVIPACLGKDFDEVFKQRQIEADAFYQALTPFQMSDDARAVQRQAFAGMLWNKQFYYFDVQQWLDGDPTMPKPPQGREDGRNHEWTHFNSNDILSMPDKWEYPWFAAWDTAFHTIPLAMIDPEFAKSQLVLLTREWYMHPNGQIPAYEWQFSDVNPPVHAWAALRVYNIERKMYGRSDRMFLERVFQKLLLNFTWWVNRKDAEGNNVFEGGFLGFDNIGVFDRSSPLPTGGYIEQADGTSWMAMYSLNMLAIALELAIDNKVYEDIATKFFEHFLYIADAMNRDHKGLQLWDEGDGFFYDVLRLPNGSHLSLKVRSMVGLIPLCAIETIEADVLDALPEFRKRMEWFMKNRPDLCQNVASMEMTGAASRRLLSIVDRDQLKRILHRMLDDKEFLGAHGIRALSKYHLEHPFVYKVNGREYTVDYEPAESTSGLFGGNSNWRGPVWFPANYLLIEALQKYDHYYGDSFTVEYPTGSGQQMNLWDVARELSSRLVKTFLKDANGLRPVYGATMKLQKDPLWSNHVLFFEYFHGDNGAGIGADHQTGWTGLVAKMIQQCAEYGGQDKKGKDGSFR